MRSLFVGLTIIMGLVLGGCGSKEEDTAKAVNAFASYFAPTGTRRFEQGVAAIKQEIRKRRIMASLKANPKDGAGVERQDFCNTAFSFNCSEGSVALESPDSQSAGSCTRTCSRSATEFDCAMTEGKNVQLSCGSETVTFSEMTATMSFANPTCTSNDRTVTIGISMELTSLLANVTYGGLENASISCSGTFSQTLSFDTESPLTSVQGPSGTQSVNCSVNGESVTLDFGNASCQG